MKVDVMITGGAGFIGFHLAKRLLAEGKSVLAIDNLNDYYAPALKNARLEILEKDNKFYFEKVDISEKESLIECVQKYEPRIIVNLAAQAGVRYSIENPDAYIQSNIIGFFNILECARRFPVEHLVYASSSSVYGANKKTPFSTEDMVDYPVSLYAATKKSNELMAYTYSHLYHIPATGLRFFTVYGPFGRPDMAYFSFTELIKKGETIQIFNQCDIYRDFTYIDHIVEGLIRIMNKPPQKDENGVKHKVYNIGNNKPEKLMNFVNILEQEIGKEAKKEFLSMQPGDVYQTYADITELERDFEFSPSTTLQKGLHEFVKWFESYYNF